MKCRTFADLHDDCLIEVLDWLSPKELFKMLRVNKQLNRLAAVKLKLKIKAICFAFPDFSTCTHLGAISSDQVVDLDDSMFWNKSLDDSSKNTFFLNVLTKCNGVKSIDLNYFQLPSDLIIEAFRRCPELDCMKFNFWDAEIKEFESILNQIGHKIVHIMKSLTYNQVPEVRLLSTVALKFANIKRIDLFTKNLTSQMLSAIKVLETCWVSVNCGKFTGNVYEDVLDELIVSEFDWKIFGNRLDRLKSFEFKDFLLSYNLVDGGVVFAGLEKLDLRYDQYCVNFFADCHYPKLEEFSFNVYGFDENDFDRLFQRMMSVKKLTIYSSGRDLQWKQNLPKSAINHLKNLETIVLVLRVPYDWQPEGFLKQFDRYVYGISSLKKLVVETHWLEDKLDERIVEEVRQLKMKQNRVEVVFVHKN